MIHPKNFYFELMENYRIFETNKSDNIFKNLDVKKISKTANLYLLKNI